MQKYKLENLSCAKCAIDVEEKLAGLKEVRYVKIYYAQSTLFIDADNFVKVEKAIKEIEPTLELHLIPDQPLQNENTNNNNHKLPKGIVNLSIVLIIYVFGLAFRNYLPENQLQIWGHFIFIIAYLLSGWKVLLSAYKKIIHGKFFDEHFLMSLATLGAVTIGQLEEAAGVMIFYQIGEFLQKLSLDKSRRSIKSLIEIKPNYANLKLNGEVKRVAPEEVKIGEIILIKPGEKVPLDGKVIDGESQIDTSPLTGEPMPRFVKTGDSILAGMINKTGLINLRVTKLFEDSSVKKILELVETATNKKAETEKFITKFSRYYTPVVVTIALLVALLPPILFAQSFSIWIYRALVLLVISCPCALVISIPLGYFGGIGAASRNGILIKGSNFLDALAEVKTVVFDKTGTLTKGVFKVTEIIPKNGFAKEELLQVAAQIESQSNHPLAQSIREAYGKDLSNLQLKNYEEIAGIGIKAIIGNKNIIAGNDLMLHRENIEHADCNLNKSVIHVAIDGGYAGYIIISDELKEDSIYAMGYLRNAGVEKIYMLTGDNHFVAQSISSELKLDGYYAELLPEEKVSVLEGLMKKASSKSKTAFVGDGINDAPVIARADVGIAMGALGSDLAIETADVVLMTDKPSKVAKVIYIAKKTRKIVWQNIYFALGVKAFFILLGSFGIATMWEAVFADMGVAIIAILNSLRVLK
ncbi:MAG: heavy metal translocating P-type ATPase [Ignavibacteriales bacterium]|nr:heavy metal translocating P-type ATPase [Ignavibacteriales bacterium]